MKKAFIILCAIALCSCGGSDSKGTGADTTQPVEDTTLAKIDFGDPFIMLYDGTYYAYGTNHPDGIAVFTSDDLYTWSRAEGASEGLALHKKDTWAKDRFWAPEVYYVNGRFYMYFSGAEHICVATSDSPLGPFVQEVKKPMIESERCIDNSLFIDDNGKPYLYFDRFNDGLNVWVEELQDNMIDLESADEKDWTKCIAVSDDEWENIWPRVNEGSFVVKHNGTYYMTYSANSYESQDYAIGVATAYNPEGPWTKYEGNPILRRPGDLVGIGHSAMFTDKEGNLRIVFHAHKSTEEIHPRNMYIGTVKFEQKDGREVMAIEPEYITARLKK